MSDARDGDGVLLTVRTSKTNQEGDAADVRYLKNGAANAIRRQTRCTPYARRVEIEWASFIASTSVGPKGRPPPTGPPSRVEQFVLHQ